MRSAQEFAHSSRRVLGLLLIIVGLAASCSRSGVDDATGPGDAQRFAPVIRDRDIGLSERVALGSLHATMAAQDRLHARILRLDRDVIGTATTVYEGRPVIMVLARSNLRRLPRFLDGQELVQMQADEFHATSYYCGTSSGPENVCNVGTLGAIVTDGVRNYWLSCWHVFVRNTGKTGDYIDSPGLMDHGCTPSTRVGAVSRFVPVRFDGSYNTVDCAIASIVVGTPVSAIEAAGANSFKPAATPAAATIGMPVKKVGRTTGFTTGKVTGINATIYVDYTGIGRANFKGVILCSPLGLEGDSGALVCTQTGSQPLGLLMSRNSTITALCPIGPVFAAVGAHIAN